MNRTRSAQSACLLFLLLLSAATCGELVVTPEPTYLRAAGAMEMAPLVAELATAFGEQEPTISLEVTGLGTEYGLGALSAGDADIALASWLLPDPSTASDLGLDARYQATAIARDGIAIVVHPGNPVEGLGLLRLQDLFGGRIYDWQAVGSLSALGEVQVVSREEGSGTRAAFEAMVMHDQKITPMATVASSPQATVDYVAGHPQALGYVSMGSVLPGVKVLKIEGELPTPGSAGRGSYALTRELWLVTADPPPEAVQLFLDFVLSPAGQQIVARRFGRIR